MTKASGSNRAWPSECSTCSRRRRPGLDRAKGGLGIGLSLAQRLTDLHGGSIRVHSDGLGHGAEFVVTLPLVEPVVQAAAPPAVQASMPAAAHAPDRAAGRRQRRRDARAVAAADSRRLRRRHGAGRRRSPGACRGAAARHRAARSGPAGAWTDIGVAELLRARPGRRRAAAGGDFGVRAARGPRAVEGRRVRPPSGQAHRLRGAGRADAQRRAARAPPTRASERRPPVDPRYAGRQRLPHWSLDVTALPSSTSLYWASSSPPVAVPPCSSPIRP